MVTLETAYNKTEASKNEEERNKYELSVFESFVDSIGQNNNKDALDEFRARAGQFLSTSQQLKYLDQDFQYFLIMPTASSLSGIGTVYFHKNILGKATMAISLGLSILTLILWPLFDRKRLGTTIIVSNISILGVFILDSVLTDVSVLFGTWTLLFLLIAQLFTRDRRPESAYR
jgi:hypothetical protein